MSDNNEDRPNTDEAMGSLKAALRTTKKTSKGSKTPQIYNAERIQCIKDLSQDPSAVVRMAVAGNENTPTKILGDLLSWETDVDVLREILMNAKTPKKAIVAFVESDDDRADQFDGEEDVIKFIRSQIIA